MNTTVSIPDELFAQAERLAAEWRVSRSQLYTTALAQFLARHEAVSVTTLVNSALEGLTEENRLFVEEAARQTLRRDDLL